MAKILSVNGQSFNYPSNRESPGWGSEATAWAEEVSDVLENVAGQGDILVSSATIANNTTSATNIPGFSFDSTVVRGAICEFSIYRSTDSDEVVEVGTLHVAYKSTAGTWEIAQTGVGSSGVVLTITSSGQMQYVSDNMAGASYSGIIKFRGRALTQ